MTCYMFELPTDIIFEFLLMLFFKNFWEFMVLMISSSSSLDLCTRNLVETLSVVSLISTIHCITQVWKHWPSSVGVVKNVHPLRSAGLRGENTGVSYSSDSVSGVHGT